MRFCGANIDTLCAPSALVVSLLMASASAAGASERELLSAALAEFSAGDRQRVEGGEPLARVIDTPDNLEIVVLGIVRLPASRESALEAFRDPKGMRLADGPRQFGRVSWPARAEEFAPFVVDPDDAKDLGRCRLGKCEIRLPEEEATHVPIVTDKGKPSSLPGDFVKHLLLNRAEQYEARGNAGLPIYQDRARSVHVAEVLTALLRLPAWVDAALPEVRAHLDSFPAPSSAEVEDFFYWTVEKRYRAPVVNLTHAALFPRACGGGCVALAAKQLYASHYFESSLDLLVFIPHDGRSYLIYLNRSRADNPRRQFWWFERALLEMMVKRMMRGDLTRLALRLNTVHAAAKREDVPAALASPSPKRVRGR
jgi:hypothetical protein